MNTSPFLAYGFVLSYLLFISTARAGNGDYLRIRQFAGTAPPAFFEHFSTGLDAGGHLHRIVEDRQGFLWCGTKTNGLLRFDGVQFTHFRNDPNDPTTIPGNRISDLLLGRDHLLYIATENGVARLNPLTGQFQAIPVQGKSVPFVCLLQTRDGQLWAGTNGSGLARYDPRRDSFYYVPCAGVRNGYTGAAMPGREFISFYKLEEAPDGALWGLAASPNGASQLQFGLVNINRQHQMPWNCFFPDEVSDPSPAPPLSLTFLENGFLDTTSQVFWVGSWGTGVLRFDLRTKRWKRWVIDLPGKFNNLENSVCDLMRGPGGMLWLATIAGVRQFYPADGRLYGFHPEAGKMGSILQDEYYAILQASDGTIWFGHIDGLSRLQPYRQQFQYADRFPPAFEAQALLDCTATGETILTAWKEDGYFYVYAGSTGTEKWRSRRQKIPYRAHDDVKVHHLLETPDGKIWVALNRGLGWLDPRSLRLELPDLPVLGQAGLRTSGLWPRQIIREPDGNLLFADFLVGLIRYDVRSGTFHLLGAQPGDGPETLWNVSLRAFCHDNKGRLWISENGIGLAVWDPHQGSLVHHEADRRTPKRLRGFFNCVIAPDQQGQLWIGHENGLARASTTRDGATVFDPIPGFHNWVWKITPDHRGRLWCLTRSGLMCYDPASQLTARFSPAEGLPVTVTDWMDMMLDRHGWIWVGAHCRFHPDSILLSPPPPKPVIASFKIYDQPAALHAAAPGVFAEIQLRPGEDVFTIEPGALAWVFPDKLRYTWCLEGLDTTWVSSVRRQAITYNRLPAGRYLFRLRVDYVDGTWGAGDAVLPLRVIPPFHQTGWFYLCCALTMAGIVYVIYLYREKQRLKLIALRNRLSRDLHDDLGSALGSIALNGAIAAQTAEPEKMRHMLSRISDEARLVSSRVRDLLWTLHPDSDNMEETLARMRQFAADLLENAGVDVLFDTDQELDAVRLDLEARRHFYLFFKEVLHNTVRHSGASQVHIRVWLEKKRLYLEIHDNGRGFDPASARRGNGLDNLAARAELLRGKWALYSAPGRETRVELSFPVT